MMKGLNVKQVSFLATFCYLMFAINYYNTSNDVENRRLSIASIPQNCTLNPTEKVGENNKPIFAASFPGSGARMSWQLIEGLTGKPTGDEWNSNGLGKQVVAVKTHWPHPTHGNKLEWGNEIKKAVIFIRNPMDALPALHNFIYSSMLEDGGDGNPVSNDLQSIFCFHLHMISLTCLISN